MKNSEGALLLNSSYTSGLVSLYGLLYIPDEISLSDPTNPHSYNGSTNVTYPAAILMHGSGGGSHEGMITLSLICFVLLFVNFYLFEFSFINIKSK